MTNTTALKRGATAYKEAESFLIDAVNALDQAHALLKDIGLDRSVLTLFQGRHVTVLEAVAIADKLLYELQHTPCAEGESE